MAKILSNIVEYQRSLKQVKPKHNLTINNVDYSAYFKSSNVSFSKDFGSASASFVLRNPDNQFSEGGSLELHVGDIVQYTRQYDGDEVEFESFYGLIEGKPTVTNASTREITISCLDYISSLKNTDITLTSEGNKVHIQNEILTPVYFTTEGETMFAQVFNFANDAIANNPPVTIKIRDKGNNTDTTEIDGYEVLYQSGQLKLGNPINAAQNYDIIADYYTYTRGVFVEEVIEDIIKNANGYDGFLFGESSADDVVSNHLTSSYLTEEGLDENGDIVNYLDYNDVAESITISHYLTSAYNPTGLVTTTTTQDFDYNTDTVMYLTSTSGIPDPGGTETEITVAGFTMTFTGVGSGNVLTGVSGSYYIVSGATVSYDTGTPVTEAEFESTDGWPDSGSASIAGDTFTWTSKDATHLYGIPSSGSNALTAKPVGAYCDYTDTYARGAVWYLLYDSISTTLTANDFVYPSGYTLQYIDHAYGRLIFTSALPTSSIVKCISDYNFSTIQSTGIEINQIKFTERNVENRYEALQKCREFLAPNYVLHTDGSNKIWGKYLYQKRVADYNLNLLTNLQLFDDSDLYTRVVMFGKNKQPTNILFNEDVQFLTTGQSYKSLASNDELVYTGTEDGWHSYETYISRAGYITAEDIPPDIYINNIKVDNNPHSVSMQPITIEKTTKTVTTTKSSKSGSTTSQQTYYYYKLQFAHQSIYSSAPIYIYNSSGALVYTIYPDSSEVDYSRGVWNVPGDKSNETVDTLSTASYTIFYADNSIKIDYDNVIFYIKESMIPETDRVVVNADYEYIHTMTPINGIKRVFDGRHDTQVQTEFFSNPPSGYNYAILDLGQTYTIQAIDMIAGFYRPDDVRKFDITFRATLQYSSNNIDYYDIGSNLTNFEMTGGAAKQFEEEDLGQDFQARYIKILLDNVSKIDYGENGVWVVAFTEISAFSDIVIRSEATLIPITYTDMEVTSATTTITVDSDLGTRGFTEPGSGETVTAYIDGNAFTYTGLTTTSFTGVTINSGESYDTAASITKSVASDSDVYDYDGLLYYQGDRLYKDNRTDNGVTYMQADLDILARAWLEEFVKNHTKASAAVIFSPHLRVGQTVNVIDPVDLTTRRMFIEGINSQGNYDELVLARYPA